METIEKKFEEYLRENGLKVTDSRKKILRAIVNSEDHFTADEFHMREFGQNGSVSRATVYRTLDVLEECGLVRKMVMRNGKSYYESKIGNTHHQHMICIECNKIKEFPGESLVDQLNMLCEGMNFEVFCHDIKVHGICRECQEKRAEQNEEEEEGEAAPDDREPPAEEEQNAERESVSGRAEVSEGTDT